MRAKLTSGLVAHLLTDARGSKLVKKYFSSSSDVRSLAPQVTVISPSTLSLALLVCSWCVLMLY